MCLSIVVITTTASIASGRDWTTRRALSSTLIACEVVRKHGKSLVVVVVTSSQTVHTRLTTNDHKATNFIGQRFPRRAGLCEMRSLPKRTHRHYHRLAAIQLPTWTNCQTTRPLIANERRYVPRTYQYLVGNRNVKCVWKLNLAIN